MFKRTSIIAILVMGLILTAACGKEEPKIQDDPDYVKAVELIRVGQYDDAERRLIGNLKITEFQELYNVAFALESYKKGWYYSASETKKKLSKESLEGEFAKDLAKIDEIDPKLIEEQRLEIEQKKIEKKQKLDNLINALNEANKDRISIGDSRETLIQKWGQPERINTTSTAYGTQEQFVYSGGQYVYVENGKVTGVQSY